MQPRISQQILSLSIAERIQLAEDIWDTVVANQQAVELTDMQKTLLQERLEDYSSNPEAGESWDKVRQRLWQSL